MKNHRIYSIIIALAIIINSQTFADTPADCASIEDNTVRLACYDGFFKDSKPKSVQTTNNEILNKANPQIAPEEKQVNSQIQQTTKVANTDNTVEKFGLIEKRIEPDLIESNIDGEFNGWTSESQFKLSNGQVWEVANASTRTMYRRSSNSPKVTIKKGLFGGYKLKVEGINRTVNVRRVK